MSPSPELYPWISAAVVAWGLLDCFFGYGIFKVTLAVLGGVLGAVFGHAAGLAMGLGNTGAIVGLILGALLGTWLAFLLYIAAVFVAGFGFGLTLGILLLTHLNHNVALLGGCVLGLVGGFLAVKVQRILIILSTALLGSFRAVLAASYFSSHLDWFFYFQQPQQLPALIDNTTWLFPAILALAAVGAFVQFGLGSGSAAKKNPKPATD